MELVIASQNTHKILEIKEIFKTLFPQFNLYSLYDFPEYQPERERGASFAENAEVKASAAAKKLQKTCLADDTGLVIPVLGGLETTLQKRYTEKLSLVQQVKILLSDLRPYKDFERAAYLECSIAIATPQALVRSATARSEGHIAESERGKISCDFDTVFVKHDYSKTLAELSSSIRSRISCRRKVCEKLVAAIESLK